VLNHVAIHEAGHAVIARVLGLKCGGATVIATEDTAGYAIINEASATARIWRQAGEVPVPGLLIDDINNPHRAAYRATILASMAGAEAERELLGQCDDGDQFDRQRIADLMAKFVSLLLDEPRLRRKTRRLVRSYRKQIERVAAALNRRRTLTAAEIDHLIELT
jgi:ATP-dependent Zn protease